MVESAKRMRIWEDPGVYLPGKYYFEKSSVEEHFSCIPRVIFKVIPLKKKE